MKTTIQTWFVPLTVVGSLLLAPLAMAQQTNVAADAQMSAPTNSPDDRQVLAVSNAPASSATNHNLTDLFMHTDDENGGQPQPIVMFGQNVELKAGDTADVVVVIGGSAKIHGKVRQAVVTIGGSSEVDGEVGDAVVAVMGNIHLKPGAKINKDAVAVMGTLTVDPGVKVAGDAVAIGGKFNIADGAKIHGQKVNVGLPIPFANIEWLGKWLRYCVFEFRPLAPQVGFVWIIAGVFFLFYLFIAAVFPRPVQVCVDGLTQRPATTFLMGLLTKILVPVVIDNPGRHGNRLDRRAVLDGGIVLWRGCGQGRNFGMARNANRTALWNRVSKAAGGISDRLGPPDVALHGPHFGTADLYDFQRLGSGLRGHSRLRQLATRNAGETNGSATGFGLTTRHGGNGGSVPGANSRCARHSSGHRFWRAGGRCDGIAGRLDFGKSDAHHASSANWRWRIARRTAGYFTGVVLSSGRLLGAHGRGVPGYRVRGHCYRHGWRIIWPSCSVPVWISYHLGLLRRPVGVEGNHDWGNCAQATGGAPRWRAAYVSRGARAWTGRGIFHRRFFPWFLLDRLGPGEAGLARQNRRDSCGPAAAISILGVLLRGKAKRHIIFRFNSFN
jgi:hypothetical protein